ncbi:hypothetical protein Tco_0650748 [Tanacetum coccineum]
MTFDETPPPSKTSPLVDDDLDEEEAIKVTEKKNLENDIKDETLEIDEIVNIKESRNHPLENVIGNLNQRTLRWSISNQPFFSDDIISSIRIDREGQVRRIRHEEEIDVLEYQILSREIVPIKHLKKYQGKLSTWFIWQNEMEWVTKTKAVDFYPMRKTRKDRGTRRGRHSTPSSSAFDQPSSSHLNDDDDDGNGEGTSRASTLSPIRYVNSLTNQVLVFQNSPNIDPHLETFYTRQIKIITRQVQIRDEQRGELRSIGKGLRNLWRNIKK